MRNRKKMFKKITDLIRNRKIEVITCLVMQYF